MPQLILALPVHAALLRIVPAVAPALEAGDAQRAREHEAGVVVRAPELRVGDDAAEAVRYGRDGEEGGRAEGGEDPDEEFVGEGRDDVAGWWGGGGRSWAFGWGVGGGGEFSFGRHGG